MSFKKLQNPARIPLGAHDPMNLHWISRIITIQCYDVLDDSTALTEK